MLTELGKALEFLQEMKSRHQFVSQRTGALHQACEQLVEEEVHCTLYIMCTSTHVHDIGALKLNNDMSDAVMTCYNYFMF